MEFLGAQLPCALQAGLQQSSCSNGQYPNVSYRCGGCQNENVLPPLARPSQRSLSISLTERKLFTPSGTKLVLVMVGLPARGKSFIAKKLCKFLGWKGFRCRVFNVGQLRRSVCAGKQSHHFFDSRNEQARQARENLACQVFDQIKTWFLENEQQSKYGDIAIFDATNTTRHRRKMLTDSMDRFAKEAKLSVYMVFIESICTNETVINANIAQKIEFSPDYANVPAVEAVTDLELRLKNYEAAYQAIDDDEQLSYIKLYDLQSKVHAKGIYGHVAKSILPYMMSIHIEHRPIWLTRAGHCDETIVDFSAIAKNPCFAPRSARLSTAGLGFAKRLAEFIQDRTEIVMSADSSTEPESTAGLESEDILVNNSGPLLVLTSTLPRAIETAQFLPHLHYEQHATLNPLDKGECYGMSMERIQDEMPETFEAYVKDPYKTRFPGGESYSDMMMRLEPILIDVEQHTGPIVVVSHISTLQVLYSYFLGIPIEKCCDLEIPFHSVLELIPNQDSWDKTIFSLQHD